MDKYENEDLLKDKIFNIFSEWREEPSTDRFIIYYQKLGDQIYKWCKNYLFRKVNNMGEEIAVVTKRIMDSKENIPSDKNLYFYYLTKALKKEKPNFYRKYNINDIKIPKEMISKIRASEDVLKMKKRNLGRELTKDEEINAISDWFGISKKRADNIMKAMEIESIDFKNNIKDEDGKKKDILDYATTPIYMENNIINPLDEYLIKIDRKNIIEAIEYLLNKKQKRARGCYRALFTLYCIENYKNYEGFNLVLDSQIIEAWKKESKYPNQYEIYQKFHPNAKKKGAEAMASKNLSEFLNDIKTYLKKSR